MRTAKLGQLEVPRIGLGAMGMSHGYTGAGTDDAESIRTIHRALDLGVTLIDTAEIYGPLHQRGARRPGPEGPPGPGGAGHQVRARRPTTAAARGRSTAARPTSASPSRARCAGSAPTTSTSTTSTGSTRSTPIEDTMGALAELVQQGKIRHVGLSEAWIDTIRRAHAVHPVTALQSEYSLWTRDQEEVLPVLRELGIGLVAVLARSAAASSPAPCAPRPTSSASTTTTSARTTRGSPARTSSATCASPTRYARSPPRPAPRRPRSPWPGCSPRATTSSPSPAPSASAESRRTPPPTASSSPPSRSRPSTALTPAEGGHHSDAQMQMIER